MITVSVRRHCENKKRNKTINTNIKINKCINNDRVNVTVETGNDNQVSIYISLCRYLSIFISLSIYLINTPLPYLSPSTYSHIFSLSLTLSLPLSPSHLLYLYISTFLLLYIYLYISLPFSYYISLSLSSFTYLLKTISYSRITRK